MSRLSGAVLEAVGDGLRAVPRTSDRVARFGGEEFAVLLPASDATAGQRAAERIRDEVARSAPRYSGHRSPPRSG